MDESILKAFVLCDQIGDTPGGSGQKDLRGAGLTQIRGTIPFPIKRTFWAYAEMTDQQESGSVVLSIMRADSGRRFFFRAISIQFPNKVQTTILAIRVFECSFPAPGVYYVELW